MALKVFQFTKYRKFLILYIGQIVLMVCGKELVIIEQRLSDLFSSFVDCNSVHCGSCFTLQHRNHASIGLELAQDDIGNVLPHHGLNHNDVVGRESLQPIPAIILGEVNSSAFGQVAVVFVHDFARFRNQLLHMLDANHEFSHLCQAYCDETEARADVQNCRLARYIWLYNRKHANNYQYLYKICFG